MGTQKPVAVGEEPVVSGPVAEHHGKKSKNLPKGKEQKSQVEEKIKEKKFAKDEEKIEEAPTEIEGAEPKKEGEAPKKKTKVGKARIRSKRYQEANKLIEPNKKYEIGEAFDLVKKTSLTKFDGNVEVHIQLIGKTGKPENLRGLLKYPQSTGKIIKVDILDEKMTAEIEKTGKAPADVYLATPAMMPKIAKLSKILGPKGKMPNPKSATITDNPEKAKKELEGGGQTEYKTDSFGNIHQIIGKVSSENKALEENLETLLAVLPVEKISNITLCATMGPGIKVQV